MQKSESQMPDGIDGGTDIASGDSAIERSQDTLSWSQEFKATFTLALPLVLTQLAQMAYFTTDVIMMGWLGKDALAAGSLATALLHPIQLFGIGALTAVAPMAAQAIGAKDYTSVRRTARQGLWLTIILGALLILLLFQSEWIFARLGQEQEVYLQSSAYLYYASWSLFPSLGVVALRGMVNAHSEAAIILWITITGIFVNALGNYALMFGNFGFPRLELVGAGISTSFVNLVGFILLISYVAASKTYSSYNLFTNFWRPDWPRFMELLKVGVPIGLMITTEVGMFSAATALMGWLGQDALAAHAVALQCAAIAFMVPLGLSQATTIRVGLAQGSHNPLGVKRAGWISIVAGTGFMLFTGALFIIMPETLIGFYIDKSNPANTIPFALAVSYLAVAALFQLVDGAQAMSAAALRGLGDTKVPMIVGIIGYWGCGLATSYYLGFVLDWQGVGIWVGLAVGLAFVAIVLTSRFALRERYGLLRH
jgi:MATE family multidrug resistance protein